MKLNATHKEVLLDRPEECIAECLEESWTVEEVQAAIASVREIVAAGHLVFEDLSEIEQAVVSNMVYCSTAATSFVDNWHGNHRRDRVPSTDFEEYNRVCIAGQDLAKHCKTEFPET